MWFGKLIDDHWTMIINQLNKLQNTRLLSLSTSPYKKLEHSMHNIRTHVPFFFLFLSFSRAFKKCRVVYFLNPQISICDFVMYLRNSSNQLPCSLPYDFREIECYKIYSRTSIYRNFMSLPLPFLF